ncbi:hypothetical protein RJ641_029785 [Dillenia turbinata]|uniref:Uncharacterized protein n=1 Tax=Dillenia turbinata TaxID=194707 RepID=A0AAN8VU93_9MAGN
MVSVSGTKLSSVVPAKATEESKNSHELKNMDLAMKVHYIRGLYWFKNEAVRGLSIYDLKKPMFPLLELYCMTAGRIRRSENGKPFVKCNDGGVRIVEAQCEKSIDEAIGDYTAHHQLFYSQVLGPDLGFSPLVYIQFTWFECGGMCVGLSWAHVLGDIFSASTFINMWSSLLSGQHQVHSLISPNTRPSHFPSPIAENSRSVKIVESTGDYWLTANNCKMETQCFHVSAKQVRHLQSEVCGLNQSALVTPFQAIVAIIWKSLAQVREYSGPKRVTICKEITQGRENEIPANRQMVCTIEADVGVEKLGLLDLAMLMGDKNMVDETSGIKEMVKSDDGKSDFLVYGANMTFVNMEDVEIYEMKINGQRPAFANYGIGGVGDEGVVLVMKGSEEGGNGRTVTVILPENQVRDLKIILKRECNIV